MTRIPGPHGPAALRAAKALLNNPGMNLGPLAAQYGRTFAIHLGPTAIVIVGDREHTKAVLTGPQDQYRWGPMFRIPLGIVVGPQSLLVSDGDDHDRRRKILQPAFALRRLEGWRSLILDEFDRLIEELPIGETIDLAPRLRATIRRIVIRVLFGATLASDADEIGDILDPVMTYANLPMTKQVPHPFPFGTRDAARRSRRAFDVRLDEEIARRRAEPAPDRGDVLDALLAVDGFDQAELRDQVVSLIGAGFDTTSATASWLVIHAASDPDVWAQLRDEANTVESERRYSEATVHELLRIQPAGGFAPRLAVKSFDLGPYRVRRGQAVAWSPLLLGRDPVSWPNPMRFDPSRHEAGDEPEYAWVPFGAGPRSCIGFGLARMELTLLASRLAQRLDLTVETNGFPDCAGMVVSTPVGGVPVTITARR